MNICIQGNLIIFAISANYTRWISRPSLAVSGLARIDENEGKSVLKFVQKVALSKNPAGSSRKAAQGKGWSKIVIKNSGVFEKIPKGVNLLFLPNREVWIFPEFQY